MAADFDEQETCRSVLALCRQPGSSSRVFKVQAKHFAEEGVIETFHLPDEVGKSESSSSRRSLRGGVPGPVEFGTELQELS